MEDLRTALETHHAAAGGWALSCCDGDSHRAEELLQSTYLRIMEGRAQFKKQSSFRTWLFGVIRNVAREERRRRSLRRMGLLKFREEPHSSVEQPDRSLARRESFRELHAQLGKLPRRQREVLHLVFYQDLTVEAAAEVMGVSVGSARQHYARAKSRMLQRLRANNHEQFTPGPAAGNLL